MKILNGVDGDGNVVQTLTLPNGNNDIAELSYDGSDNILLTLVGIKNACSGKMVCTL
jgi:hypothetical protein